MIDLLLIYSVQCMSSYKFYGFKFVSARFSDSSLMGNSIVTDVQVGQHMPPDMMKIFTIVMILLTWIM